MERDDDLDTMGSGIKDAEINYLSSLEASGDGDEGVGGGKQPLQPEDYLEPRVNGRLLKVASELALRVVLVLQNIIVQSTSRHFFSLPF